jgi:hypothetical protein
MRQAVVAAQHGAKNSGPYLTMQGGLGAGRLKVAKRRLFNADKGA